MEPHREDDRAGRRAARAAARARRGSSPPSSTPGPRPASRAAGDRWSDAPGRLIARLSAVPPRRLAGSAGAAALATIAVATALVATSQNGSSVSPAPLDRRVASGPAASAEAGQAAPSTAEPPAEVGSAAASAGEVEIQSSVAPSPAPFAPGREARDVERSATIVLGTSPARVRADAARVFDAVHEAHGIVLHSAVHDGSSGRPGAEFDLLIPTPRLDDALAALSAIGDVRARRESSLDITGPTARTEARLKEAHEQIVGLLEKLSTAEGDAERTALEAKLRGERSQASTLRSHKQSLDRRASFSRVALRIETGEHGAATAAGPDGGWGIDDGLHAAGRVLSIAAGVTIVGLAVLAPLLLLALAALFGRRAWLRAARARAL